MTPHPTRTEVVRLRFKDGEILEAKLVSVDHYDDAEIVDTPWGARMFRLRGPDGFRLTISSKHAA